MPGVVLDSTCLIALERIGQPELLPRLFSPLFAPPAVAEEFGQSFQWLAITPVANTFSVATLRQQLGRGEAEAIALANEAAVEIVVLDDKKARRVAQSLGLRTIGTLGIILRAKKDHLIPECRPVLDDLLAVGFHMSQDLYREVLTRAWAFPDMTRSTRSCTSPCAITA